MPNITERSRIDWADVDDPATHFKNKTLARVDFSGSMLAGIDFSGSTLHECIFDDADLSHADFEDADLYSSTFKGAVLYATNFSGCNLTRCDFSGSFVYGFRMVEFMNITYADFSGFKLEDRRRGSQFATTNTGGLRAYTLGERIENTAELSRADYFVKGITFSFREFLEREQEMQRSQIFNRLKRLYEANGFSEEARHCLYHEKYHRTRSHYLSHNFPETPAAKGKPVADFRSRWRTITGYAFEALAGYGLRPKVVLRNMLGVYFLYVLVAWLLINGSQSGVAYTAMAISQPDGVVTNAQTRIVGPQLAELPKVMYFCLFSMFSLTFQRFNPYGHLVWLSSAFALVGLSLLALLVTSVYSVMRSD